MENKRWDIFLSSVFFVLGFSVVFSLLGVLLQTVFFRVSLQAQQWLGRIGGIIIILFGLYLIGLIRPKFLEKEHKFNIKRKFKSAHITSFVFGAAFAVGWTPCVGAILGAILTLAVTQPSIAFFLLLSYSLGLGIPFLLVGLFTNESQKFINKFSKYFKYLNFIFGLIIILLGILVFTNQLARIANFAYASEFLLSLDLVAFSGTSLNIGVAFIAGIISFLSPCVLPLIPAFLTYLASTAVRKQ